MYEQEGPGGGYDGIKLLGNGCLSEYSGTGDTGICNGDDGWVCDRYSNLGTWIDDLISMRGDRNGWLSGVL